MYTNTKRPKKDRRPADAQRMHRKKKKKRSKKPYFFTRTRQSEESAQMRRGRKKQTAKTTPMKPKEGKKKDRPNVTVAIVAEPYKTEYEPQKQRMHLFALGKIPPTLTKLKAATKRLHGFFRGQFGFPCTHWAWRTGTGVIIVILSTHIVPRTVCSQAWMGDERGRRGPATSHTK